MAKQRIIGQPKFYQSIDDLILYNFDRYMATKDNNWFIIGYTGRETKIQSADLNKVEEDLLEEYFTASDDRSFQKKLQAWAKIDNLVAKYNVVSELVKVIAIGFEISKEGQEMRYRYLKMLEQWKYSIPIMNSPSGDLEECNKIINQLQVIKTQIALLKSGLKEDSRSESISLNKQLQIVALSLGYSYRLNPKEITVSEWIEMGKLMQEKAKQN